MSDGFKGVESLKNSSRTYPERKRDSERERGLHSRPNRARLLSHHPVTVVRSSALHCPASDYPMATSRGRRATPLIPKWNFTWSWAPGLPLRCGQCARCASNHEQLAHCLPLAALREKVAANFLISLFHKFTFFSQYCLHSFCFPSPFISLCIYKMADRHSGRRAIALVGAQAQPNPQGAYQSVKLSLGSRSRAPSDAFQA